MPEVKWSAKVYRREADGQGKEAGKETGERRPGSIAQTWKGRYNVRIELLMK